MAIWTNALWFLCESMNFHPDKQLFQVAGETLGLIPGTLVVISLWGANFCWEIVYDIEGICEICEKDDWLFVTHSFTNSMKELRK